MMLSSSSKLPSAAKSEANMLNENPAMTKYPIYLFMVKRVVVNDGNNSKELLLCKIDSSEKMNPSFSDDQANETTQRICYLFDSWSNCKVEVNDIVHILTHIEIDGTYRLDESKGYLIVNPHYVVSGTNIIMGLGCMRKSTLNWKFKDTGNNGASQYMILGTLLHMLFQYSITNQIYDKDDLKKILVDLLHERKIVTQLYEADKNEEYILEEASVYLQSIERWLHENVKNKVPANGNRGGLQGQKNFQVLNVCDIEESIWSPKYGIKGKLDLTLHVNIKPQGFKTLARNTRTAPSKSSVDTAETHVIPVELKSGRTTFSVEHEGQVILYSLLNKEKRDEMKHTDFGLLLYLKDMNMKFIKINHNNVKGLIQLRNDLVHYISKNKWSELKNEERFCSKCPQLITCSLFNENSKKIAVEENRQQEPEPAEELELYADSVMHLSLQHRDFFFKWYKMMELEFSDLKQFDSGDDVWWKSRTELETLGYCIFDLRLASKPDMFEEANSRKDVCSIDGNYLFDFTRDNASQIGELYLKENDMVLLSSQTDNLVGIAQGFIKSIRNNRRDISITIDKNLYHFFKSNSIISNKKLTGDVSKHLFRIDKINYRSAISLNYTNLSRLMMPTEASMRLRSFIIEKKKPEFDSVLSKHMILKTKHFFKKLNQSQQAAILKAMMAKDYLLIKGYPGTGKTTTIATLINVLVKLEKKILFTSFTNSAVDNLLLKLVNDENKIDMVRIGSFERVHADLQKYEAGFLTSKLTSVEELDKFYKEKQLVATTCSSFGNPVFNKFQFDYCIIDEASQVLLTTCLGPLFTSKKFILVGDLEQLPPIIKNKDARNMGMGISLFEWLDSKEGSVELVHQYRMNKEIMYLANEITYCGKLKCVSEAVAESSIKIDQAILKKVVNDNLKFILTSPIVFIDTSEIIKKLNLPSEPTTNDYKTVNPIECKIVSQLCELFYKNSDCKQEDSIGIIAPYNNQVKQLNAVLKAKHPSFYKDLEINTVDQFQGRDKRMIIMSFTNSIVRTTDDSYRELEILNDKRRLTVAITRSKQKLIMIGSVDCLKKYKTIGQLITTLNENNYVLKPQEVDDLFN